MLRLWPERLVATIFPDCSRLYRAGSKEVANHASASTNAVDVRETLDALLGQYPLGQTAALELIVSDSLARLVPLPWQDSLQSDAQREAYARACFEQAGFDLDDGWVVQTTYRHFRGMGLGYALPRLLVADLLAHLPERRVQLRSIMPVSACAYWRHRSGIRGKRTVLLLRERGRLSALLFEGKNCTGLHVQPLGQSFSDGVNRLISTVDAVFPSVSRFQFWTAGEDDMEADLIKRRVEALPFDVLPRLAWQ